MKRLLTGFALLALALIATPGRADTREDAYAGVEAWAAAFNAHDLERIMATFTPDALVFGTASQTLATSQEDVRKYFANAARLRFGVKIEQSSAKVLSNEAVVFAGLYEFTRQNREGQTISTPARFSILMVKHDGTWKIAHFHSSMRPRPRE